MSSIDDYLKQAMETNARKTADDTMKASARGAESAGLITKVIRTYDDVGLHGGKDRCEWCANRAGEWTYEEAIRNGVFERHPGCGCEIEVVTSKGNRRQTDWAHNKWSDYDPKRRYYGLDGNPILQTGGREIGGHYYKDNPEDEKRDIDANREYERISRNNRDIKEISDNTGFGVKEIETVKTHVFFEKHDLYNGYERLAPDYNMAIAWRRLEKGEFLERDILLLKHELLEAQLEKQYNISLSEAHARATEVYDWWGRLQEETEGEGEPDGLL